jgi:acyl-coenzyme A synthetase/AMP-(fatty) acid ligase
VSPWRLAGDRLAALGDRIALEGQGARVSYADLAGRAASVWRALGKAGVLPGGLVALVSSGRAHDEAVGLTGILTLGAVAVPLDATAPPHRLASILAARGCRAIVLDEKARPLADAVEAELGRLLPHPSAPDAPLARVILDAAGVVVGASGKIAPEAMDPSRGALSGSLACVLHTSGSTGLPKPVPITWAGLDAFTDWAIEQFAITPADRVLRVAELIFDLAWFDHLATFRAGATLLTMSRRELAAGAAFRDALRALAPSVVYGVPSLFMKLSAALPEGAPLLPAPRAVLYAGEVFPPRELRAFAERVPDASIWNLYGPTETNVCTFHPIERAALDGERETPIGSACPYARCSLLGEDGARIEGPGTGELIVEGPTTLGGGPFATRDRVERGTDGLFYFRGRIDRMIKIRGYRVDPGEIEAVLGAHPDVRQAAVVVHDDARIGKTLRVFMEIRPDAPPMVERDFRIFLAERLPSYMVPERVTALSELPRTPTGKIDYRALADRPS